GHVARALVTVDRGIAYFVAPSPGLDFATTGGENISYPVCVGPVRKRDQEAASAPECPQRSAEGPARLAAAMDHHRPAGRPGGDELGDPIEPDLVGVGNPSWSRHGISPHLWNFFHVSISRTKKSTAVEFMHYASDWTTTGKTRYAKDVGGQRTSA